MTYVPELRRASAVAVVTSLPWSSPFRILLPAHGFDIGLLLFAELPNTEPPDSCDELPNNEPPDGCDELPNTEPPDGCDKLPNTELGCCGEPPNTDFCCVEGLPNNVALGCCWVD